MARAGSEFVVGEWNDAFTFTLTSRQVVSFAHLQVESHETGTISGRVLVNGFGRRATVEIGVGSGEPSNSGFVQTDANGFFTYIVRQLVADDETTVQVRVIDATGAASDWNELPETINFDPQTSGTASLDEFELAHDTGGATSPIHTADPTVIGRVTTDAPFLVKVEFDYDGDDAADDFTYLNTNGAFQFTPIGWADSTGHTVRARYNRWDPGPSSPGWVPGSWTEQSALEFTLDSSDNLPAAIDTLGLRQNSADPGETPQSADATFVGTVTNDGGSVAGLVVRFDHNGDHTADDFTVTDSTGRFVYHASGLAPSSQAQTITAWVEERNYAGQVVANAPRRQFSFILDDAPIVSDLAYNPAATPDPTVTGSVSWASLSDLQVEYQFFSNGARFAAAPTSFSNFDFVPGVVREVVDPNTGAFTIDADGLAVGDAWIAVRAVQVVDDAVVKAGPWTTYEFQVGTPSGTVADIDDFTLLNDDDMDHATNNPKFSGHVADDVPYAVVQIDAHVHGGEEIVFSERVNADQDGNFLYTPSTENWSPETIYDFDAHVVVWNDETHAEEVPTLPTSYSPRRDVKLKIHTGATITNLDQIPDAAANDPTIVGTVENANGRVAGLRVEFEWTGDDAPDGFAFTDGYGNFQFTPQGFPTNQPTTIRAA